MNTNDSESESVNLPQTENNGLSALSDDDQGASRVRNGSVIRKCSWRAKARRKDPHPLYGQGHEDTFSFNRARSGSPDLSQDIRGTKKAAPTLRTAGIRKRPEIRISVQLSTLDTQETFAQSALIDCGATASFIDKRIVDQLGWNYDKLEHSITLINVDGSPNTHGAVDEYIRLRMDYKGHREVMTFFLANIGSNSMILGLDWLKEHDPNISWRTGNVTFDNCPETCRRLESQPSDSILGDEWYCNNDKTEWYHINEVDWIADPEWDSIPKEELPTYEEDPKFLIPEEYHDWMDVFSKDSFDELPPHSVWDHEINLRPDFVPKHSPKVYPFDERQKEALREFLNENIESGRIRPSKSEFQSPVFFVKKKDGGLRLVQDYRELNKGCIRDRYPLPLISELMNQLKGAKYFTALDIRWGYNNIRIREGDEWKAAFKTGQGSFEPLVMFFGLSNSPATFQRMMNHIFFDLIMEGRIVVYLDDILIFSDDIDEHRRTVQEVLERLRRHHLYLNPKKCKFNRETIEYLGLIISHNQVEMDPKKVEAVRSWPMPTSKKKLQSFLGFINFYRRFIKDFAKHARPLHQLTGKTDWKWTSACTIAFNFLVKAITSAPILRMPMDEAQFRVEADSSDFATGAVLEQFQDDKWFPIAYLSKTLNETERNYPIHDKELLAIIRALKEWRYLLEGHPQTLLILSDHKNLEYFRNAQNLSRRQARWADYLERFNFEIKHVSGKKQGKSDGLSRRADYDQGKEDNRGRVLLDSQFFIQLMDSFEENDILAEIKSNLSDAVIAEKKDLDGWAVIDGILLFDDLVFVPDTSAGLNDLSLRVKVIKEHHDVPTAGHPGIDKTYKMVTRNYIWPDLRKDIIKYVKSCPKCQKTKTYPSRPAGLLQPNRVPEGPWQDISIDLITGLPESKGYDSICVTVDRFTKMIHLVPITAEVTSLGIAKIMRDVIWKHHGLPQRIISDRGPQFVSNFSKEFNKLTGITIAASTAFHPHTDGQTERVNQDVEQFRRLYTNYGQNDWSEWLSMAEFAYNNRKHSATGVSPFFANTGRHPPVPTQVVQHSSNETAQDFAERMTKIKDKIEIALTDAADDMKRFADRKRKPQPEYQVGDKVWLEGTNIRTERPSKKLEDRRYGPFKITKVLSPTAVQLQLPVSWKIHPTFHVVKLRPFIEDRSMHPEEVPPPPDLDDDGELQYEVEEVLDSRRNKRRRNLLEYKVHWKGYPREDDSWLPHSELQDTAPELLQEFHDRYPKKPRPL